MIKNRNKKDVEFLSKNLEKLLKKKGMSQAQLANKVRINKSTLHGYLNGIVPNNIISLKRIADFFEISVDELVFEIQEKNLKIHKQDNKVFLRYEILIREI